MANGEHLQTIETRWGQAIDRMFDSPEARVLMPAPSLWPAFLNPTEAAIGSFRPPEGKTNDVIVIVRINHGVWQAVCPFCPSAQHASREDPWFYCAVCHNEAIGFKAAPIAWPVDHEELGALLLEVRQPALRNWEPDETVADITLQVADYKQREAAHAALLAAAEPEELAPDLESRFELPGAPEDA